MKIILISGQNNQGKDIVANYLANKLKFERGSFAKAVKEIYKNTFGVNDEFIEEWKRKQEIPPNMLTPVRQGLQFIGDGFRKIKESVWVDIVLKDDNLCISDGRYINEAKTVKEKDGISVVLYRKGYLNDDPNDSEAQIRPIVEFCGKYLEDGVIPCEEDLQDYPYPPTALKFYDFFLSNDGSLEDLYAKTDDLLIPYIRRKYGIL